MRDVRAATNAGGPGASPTSSSSNIDPSIQHRFSGISEIGSEASTSSGGGVDPSTGEGLPMPSAEEQEQMLGFLLGLQSLKETNPAEYEKAIDSLMNPPMPPGSEGNVGENPNIARDSNGKVLNAEENLTQMIEQIQFMRSAASAGGNGASVGSSGPGIVGSALDKDKEIFENLQANKKPVDNGITITPTPGFSYKTKTIGPDANEGMKVFVNLCTHELIDKPGIKKRLAEDGSEVEGMNIPMSVGQARTGADNKGVVCTVYDIIVNPNVLADSLQDKTGKYRDFVCQLGMQYLEQKYQPLQLDRRYKLPKLKYMYTTYKTADSGSVGTSQPGVPVGEGSEKIGVIETQRIQDRKKQPKIEEVDSETDPEAASKAALARLRKKEKEEAARKERERAEEVPLPHKTHMKLAAPVDEEEEVLEELLLSTDYTEPYQLPDDHQVGIIFQSAIEAHHIDASKIDFQLSPFRFHLKLPGFLPVRYYLPYAVDIDQMTVSLSKRSDNIGVIDLKIYLPFDFTDFVDNGGADPGSKIWLVQSALAADEAEGEVRGGKKEDSGAEVQQGRNPYRKKKDEHEVSPAEMYHIDTSIEGNGILHADEDMDLPEDRFHQHDATSSYYISQREEGIKDKWAKADKDREERLANPDPNVEYIDMEEYNVGGKRGISVEEQIAKIEASDGDDVGKALAIERLRSQETLQKASEVMMKNAEDTSEANKANTGEDMDGKDDEDEGGLNLSSLGLSSSKWSQLIE